MGFGVGCGWEFVESDVVIHSMKAVWIRYQLSDNNDATTQVYKP
ncbi:hypothetical protein BMS3Bbin02_01255 [bacterium BMS3Bbin02]|nr:hypothetical protein BMS3Bbin02_01255 [bacterium BMS3Bbin02]